MERLRLIRASAILLLLGSFCTSQLLGVEMPRRADDFVDAMGINVHLDITGQPYAEATVGQLGIRHVRSNTKPDSTTLLSRLAALYSDYGVRINLVCDSTSYTPAQYAGLMAGTMFETVEGLNEPDAMGPRTYLGLTDNWSTQSYPATLAFQKDLFNAMTAESSTSSKAVLSPAMANPVFSRYLRTAEADFISVHSYPSSLMPTGDYLTSFTFPSARAMAVPGAGVMQMIATETGYQSGTSSGNITELASEKYVPRVFAEYFRLGVARTFLYELADTSSSLHYGILDINFSPKPAYSAVKNLIGLLVESVWNSSTKSFVSPATFNPGVLDYTMTGITPDVHHVVLQKSNGVFYVLLWQEVSSFNTSTKTDISNATVPVNLSFNFPVATAAFYNLESTNPVATYAGNRSITVNVPDEVVVLEVTPGTANPGGEPAVSVFAAPAGSTVLPLVPGAFALTRAGSTSAPLIVSYSMGGTANNGTNYASIPGSVQFPIGSSAVSIPFTPQTASFAGSKQAVMTLANGPSFSLGAAITSTAFINANQTLVANFDTGIQGTSANPHSAISWDKANADTGAGDLKWVFNDDGVDEWANAIQINFAAPQDWSSVTQIQFRFKEDAGNPALTIGQPIYFAWYNNGVRIGGGSGVAKFPLSDDPAYRTVSIDLGDLPRNQMTGLMFWVDGSNYPKGSYTFYIDNVYAVTDSNGVLDDIEQYAGSNWAGSLHSTVVPNIPNADTGLYALKWTYSDNGYDEWSNSVKLNFPHEYDLSRYTTISIRFKEDPSNPPSDVGKAICFEWFNAGTSCDNNGSVASIPLKGPTGYRTVELSLGSLKRDRVDDLYFYIDGKTLATGTHIWYIDNVTVY